MNTESATALTSECSLTIIYPGVDHYCHVRRCDPGNHLSGKNVAGTMTPAEHKKFLCHLTCIMEKILKINEQDGMITFSAIKFLISRLLFVIINLKKRLVLP